LAGKLANGSAARNPGKYGLDFEVREGNDKEWLA
jgi:hypothetical protein